MNNIEYRTFAFTDDNYDADSHIIRGLAIPVESRSQLLGGKFYEVIAREAVSQELIDSNDVRLLYDHNPAAGTIGRSKFGVGTLRLYVDDEGLKFECEIPNTPFGKTIEEGIRRKDIDGVSFGFYVGKDEKEKNADGTFNRRVLSFRKLVEISVLDVLPAYTDTQVAVRAIEEIEEQEKIEAKKKNDEELEKIRDSFSELFG
jgi:HK97 family phage prohead protease